MKYLITLGFLILATSLESSGDALVRKGLFDRQGAARAVTLLTGAVLLFGYGVFLNLAPMPFGRVVGIYIATLFVVWQVVSYVSFGTFPTTPVLVGGSLIVVGGLLVAFWNP